MRMNPGIAMQGQPVNVLGAMDAGMQMGHRQNEMQRQNALAQAMQEHGPGLVQGDQGAASELAQYDPQMVAGVQNTQNQMQDRQARLAMAREQAGQQMAQRAQQMSQAELDAERQNIERGLAMGTKASNEEEWDAAMRSVGADDMVGQFENREMLIAGAMGIMDALDHGQPTTAVQSLQQRAAAAGLEPGTPEYQEFMREGGGAGTNVTVNTGDQGQQMGGIPQGYAAVEDPTNPSGFRMEPIPGGPAELQAEQTQRDIARADREGQARSSTRGRVGGTAVDEMNFLLEGLGLDPESGEFGESQIAGPRRRSMIGSGEDQGRISRMIWGGSNTIDFLNTLQSLQDTIAIDRLLEIKEAGSGLGQVPQSQLRALARAMGNLDASSSDELLRNNLMRARSIYEDVVRQSLEDVNDPTFRGLIQEVAPGAQVFVDDEDPAEQPRNPRGSGARISGQNGGDTEQPSRTMDGTQGQDLTADQLRGMSRDDFLALDPMSIPDALLDDYEARLREFGNE